VNKAALALTLMLLLAADSAAILAETMGRPSIVEQRVALASPGAVQASLDGAALPARELPAARLTDTYVFWLATHTPIFQLLPMTAANITRVSANTTILIPVTYKSTIGGKEYCISLLLPPPAASDTQGLETLTAAPAAVAEDAAEKWGPGVYILLSGLTRGLWTYVALAVVHPYSLFCHRLAGVMTAIYVHADVDSQTMLSKTILELDRVGSRVASAFSPYLLNLVRPRSSIQLVNYNPTFRALAYNVTDGTVYYWDYGSFYGYEDPASFALSFPVDPPEGYGILMVQVYSGGEQVYNTSRQTTSREAFDRLYQLVNETLASANLPEDEYYLLITYYHTAVIPLYSSPPEYLGSVVYTTLLRMPARYNGTTVYPDSPTASLFVSVYYIGATLETVIPQGYSERLLVEYYNTTPVEWVEVVSNGSLALPRPATAYQGPFDYQYMFSQHMLGLTFWKNVLPASILGTCYWKNIVARLSIVYNVTAGGYEETGLYVVNGRDGYDTSYEYKDRLLAINVTLHGHRYQALNATLPAYVEGELELGGARYDSSNITVVLDAIAPSSGAPPPYSFGAYNRTTVLPGGQRLESVDRTLETVVRNVLQTLASISGFVTGYIDLSAVIGSDTGYYGGYDYNSVTVFMNAVKLYYTTRPESLVPRDIANYNVSLPTPFYEIEVKLGSSYEARAEQYTLSSPLNLGCCNITWLNKAPASALVTVDVNSPGAGGESDLIVSPPLLAVSAEAPLPVLGAELAGGQAVNTSGLADVKTSGSVYVPMYVYSTNLTVGDSGRAVNASTLADSFAPIALAAGALSATNIYQLVEQLSGVDSAVASLVDYWWLNANRAAVSEAVAAVGQIPRSDIMVVVGDGVLTVAGTSVSISPAYVTLVRVEGEQLPEINTPWGTAFSNYIVVLAWRSVLETYSYIVMTSAVGIYNDVQAAVATSGGPGR